MLVIPAIDLRGARLARAATDRDPASQAAHYAAAGATWLHVVDLDRATGVGRHDALVRALARQHDTRVQLGGALTDAADVREALGWDVARVMVGADAGPEVGALVREHGVERIGAAVDVGPERAVAGVEDAADTLDALVAQGVRVVIVRDLARDGRLGGSSVRAVGRLVGRGADLFVAGGIASLDELRAARDLGLAGAIVGRALVDERFTVAEALACCG
ncbi:MAG: HisA/HisF-related TIM barrel protein [Gemmatimonadota bacterium]|nr:HisA/HisF-related TIM barrel protein [Gemmatimonadota bacterium]